jgi:aspartate 1-decarboxylase
MTREMLRAKVHRITVTERNVEYEGSLTLDAALMEAGDMIPFERVEIYDVDNGNRFATYLIEGERGSGACCVNGAAARLVEEGHKLILACYCAVDESAARGHRPKVVLVDSRNRLSAVKDHEGPGVRVEL